MLIDVLYDHFESLGYAVQWARSPYSPCFTCRQPDDPLITGREVWVRDFSNGHFILFGGEAEEHAVLDAVEPRFIERLEEWVRIHTSSETEAY